MFLLVSVSARQWYNAIGFEQTGLCSRTGNAIAGCKSVKKLFKSIREGNIDEVRHLIERKPKLVNCVAKQPPKKDDGQSPLQVAIKLHRFEIANDLIDHGADINFMGDPTTCCDDWCMPVLHLSVMVAVSCCRHNSQFATDDKVFFSEYSTKEEADASFALLRRLLEMGADVTARESHGTSLAWRLCRTAADLLPQYHWGYDTVSQTAVLTSEWKRGLKRIFLILKEYKTDFGDEEVQRYLTKHNHPLVPFLSLVLE